MIHNFRTEKRKGDVGETTLARTYTELERLDGFKSDMLYTPSNKLIEVKTDYYSMARTPNFFIERYSNETGAPGGPWQALEKGNDGFLYFFIKNNILFWFDNIKAIIKSVDDTVEFNNTSVTPVRNETHITYGYKIPRESLKELYIEFNLGDDINGIIG